jgi:hypothetical protein
MNAGTRKITHKPLNCSPKPNKNKINKFSCFTNDSLLKLRDKWNHRHGKNDTIKSSDPHTIWKTIKYKLSHKCDKESCWVKDIVGENHELMSSFSPESPESWKKNMNEWLSDSDIRDVLKQYEKSYTCFEFIGPTPIDFDFKKKTGECVENKLCRFDLQKLIDKNKTKIGVSFNLDPHYKGGSHWVSLFINVKKGWIFYFDSTGDKIPKEVQMLVDRVIQQGLSLNRPIHFTFSQNSPFSHQKGDTECGMYSLYFILQMLKDDKSPNYFKTHLITDKQMEKYRKIYFNEEL